MLRRVADAMRSRDHNLSILYLRCGAACILHHDHRPLETFNSLFEMRKNRFPNRGRPRFSPFNSLFEMLGVLVFGFCGFLSFCDSVYGVLTGAC